MRDKHGVYGRRELLSLYSAALAPSYDMQSRLRSLGLWTVCRLKAGRVYRGRRAGRQRRPLPTTRRLDNGAYVITGNRPTTPAKVRRPPSVITVHVDRHSVSTGAELAFSCLNIRSLTYKLDDLLEVRLIRCNCESDIAYKSRKCRYADQQISCTRFCACTGGPFCFNKFNSKLPDDDDDDGDIVQEMD